MAIEFPYFVILNDSKERHQLDETSIFQFMHSLNCNEGELYLNQYSGIKIKYNVITGHVKPVSVEEKQNITTSYSSKSFENLINPIIDAIKLLAKAALLMKLYDLGDADICNIIKRQHYRTNKNEFTNVSHNTVDQTLAQIQTMSTTSFFNSLFKLNKTNPIQKMVSKALSEMGIDNIRSVKDVEKIMQSIQNVNYLEKHAKKP